MKKCYFDWILVQLVKQNNQQSNKVLYVYDYESEKVVLVYIKICATLFCFQMKDNTCVI